MPFRILHYESLDSTNNLALTFAKQGAQEGTVIVAEYQTKGRGRFERTWISPKGKGLLFSFILRPSLSTASLPILTHIAAQSVADLLKKDFHLAAKLKKPNDVLVGQKKIAGILTESSTINQKTDYVVVGIGLNVNTESRHLLDTATSIYAETKKKSDKGPILKRFLSIFWEKYQEIDSKKKVLEPQKGPN